MEREQTEVMEVLATDKIGMRLDALYAQLPALACQRKCQSCCGPIQATAIEKDRILRRHHRVLAPDHTGVRCRLLTEDGACSVYADRPLICRVIGLSRATACPYGCVPESWLPEHFVSQCMQTLFRIQGGPAWQSRPAPSSSI